MDNKKKDENINSIDALANDEAALNAFLNILAEDDDNDDPWDSWDDNDGFFSETSGEEPKSLFDTKTPIVFCFDFSKKSSRRNLLTGVSLRDLMNEVIIETFFRGIRRKILLEMTLDFSAVTHRGGIPLALNEFSRIRELTSFDIPAQNYFSVLDESVKLALDLIENQIEFYKVNDISYRKAKLVIFSDNETNALEYKVARLLYNFIESDLLNLVVVDLSDEGNLTKLGQLTALPVIKVQKTELKDFFIQLVESLERMIHRDT